MARHCAVTGCSNGDFRLNRCRKDWCKVHNYLNSNPPCSCEPPCQLFNFPTAKKHPESRLLWCKLVNRAPSDQSNSSQPKLWAPGPKSRICSSHFVDGEPTEENPHTTLNLGYPNFEKRVQAILGKKGKQELLMMVYLPPQIYPNRVRMKIFQELLLKKKIN